MKIVFFGTPDYVVPIAETINKTFREGRQSPVVAVVTKAPYADKDGKQIFSEVDHWAHKRNIPKFYSPQEFADSSIEADLGIVASYSQIIPQLVIENCKLGILNLHPSLLPKYRGASPVPATLAMNETLTGVSIIRLDKELDHGDIMTSFTEEVLPYDTNESLRARLFNRGAEALVEMIPAYITNKIKPKPQDHAEAVFTRELVREDGFLPIEILLNAIKGQVPTKPFTVPFIKTENIIVPDATFIERYLRALTPWPGIYTQIDGKRLKILKVHTDHDQLVIDTVQLEGKNEVSFKQFLEGYPQTPFASVTNHE